MEGGVFGHRDRFMVSFALVRSRPAAFGLVEMWVGGVPIGLRDEPTFLFPILSELEWLALPAETEASARFAPPRAHEDLLYELETGQAWAEMEGDDPTYRFSPIEFFDNEDIFVARDETTVRWIWRPITRDDGSVFDRRVPLKDIVTVSSALRRVYEATRVASLRP